jgi:hypothetical protein
MITADLEAADKSDLAARAEGSLEDSGYGLRGMWQSSPA